MNSQNSYRSFYITNSTKLISIKPSSSDLRSLLAKNQKLEQHIIDNKADNKRSMSFHQKSMSNKSNFNTPSITNSQRQEVKEKAETKNLFIINKAIKNMPILEKLSPPTKNFIDHLEMKKLDFKNNINIPKIKEKEIAADNKSYRNSYEFLYVIGKGGFGKVWKVRQKKTNRIFAMKEMMKAKVIAKRSVHSVMNERDLLSKIKHPFMINMICAFQDRDNLCLVMDLMTGGDLRYHIGRNKRFSEEQTKFFIACIYESLEYLHNNGIIHRDLKPENLVLDDKGYVRLTDLGVARILKPENSCDTSGTPGYMAPEVMCRLNHGIGVDYYALGVIAFEFMFGRRPYLGRDRKEIREAILAKQVQIKRHEIPSNWSVEAADFVNKLIQRKPQNRLGNNNPEEVKNHPWLRDFPWEKLKRKEVKSPFIPNIHEDNFDKKQTLTETEENEELIRENLLLLKKNSVQELFSGYNFDNTNDSTTIHHGSSKTERLGWGTINTTGSTASSHLI